MLYRHPSALKKKREWVLGSNKARLTYGPDINQLLGGAPPKGINPRPVTRVPKDISGEFANRNSWGRSAVTMQPAENLPKKRLRNSSRRGLLDWAGGPRVERGL